MLNSSIWRAVLSLFYPPVIIRGKNGKNSENPVGSNKSEKRKPKSAVYRSFWASVVYFHLRLISTKSHKREMTQNAARLDQILQSPALDIERIYFETPEQAEALSLAQKIPIMTLAFPSEKDCFSVALLKEVPSVKLGMIFRKKDQAELEPLLNYFRAYFIRHQQDFLPLKPLISNMTA